MRTYIVLPASGNPEITLMADDFTVDGNERVLFERESIHRNVAVFNFKNITGFFELQEKESEEEK